MGRLEPAVCAVVTAGVLWLAWQWLGRRGGQCGQAFTVVGSLLAAAALLVPVAGLPVWQWVYSFCPNPSLPLLVLVVLALWRQLGGRGGFQRADWDAAWVFGAVAGTLLYLHPLLPDSWNFYYWGWQHAVTVGALAALALGALSFGSRFGLVLLGSLIAYELSLLESPNGWDYVVDPFYWVLSLALGARRLWKFGRRAAGPRPVPGGHLPG